MNKSGVLTTQAEIEEFVGFDYSTPKEECMFVGRLVCRNWYNNRNVYGLVCNFITEGGRKVALFAFRHKLPNEIYAPPKCDIDFAHDVKDGSIWRCTYAYSKFGRLFWKSAELIAESGDDTLLRYEQIQTYSQEQIDEAIAKREQRKQEKAAKERQREKRRQEQQYKKDLKADNWWGRRLRLVKSYRENKLTPKHMKDYAAATICFVISTDRKTMCCPKGIFFKTCNAQHGKAKVIHFPESCQDCEIKKCQGSFQKQIQLSNDSITTEERYHEIYDDDNESRID